MCRGGNASGFCLFAESVCFVRFHLVDGANELEGVVVPESGNIFRQLFEFSAAPHPSADGKIINERRGGFYAVVFKVHFDDVLARADMREFDEERCVVATGTLRLRFQVVDAVCRTDNDWTVCPGGALLLPC